MKKLIFCCAIALLNPLTAIATPVVRTIERSQASGTTALIQTINVWNGNGVSISFYETGETIKRVWIDDPSQILIDTDGCLEGINQNCRKPGAGLIHLRRIKKVNIQGLPQTKNTLLTIITENSGGERKVYSFRLAVSNGNPKYSQVAIINDVVVDQDKPIPQLQSIKLTYQTTRDIRNGMAVAVRRKLLNPSDQLYQRLQQVATNVQLGDDIKTAASKAGVSIELINKLISLGQKS